MPKRLTDSMNERIRHCRQLTVQVRYDTHDGIDLIFLEALDADAQAKVWRFVPNWARSEIDCLELSIEALATLIRRAIESAD